MFIRKDKIQHTIENERMKERDLCARENSRRTSLLKKNLRDRHKREVEDLKKEYEQVIENLQYEIELLRREINSNHDMYQEIRRREDRLDELTSQIEGEVESMLIKVHESTQPFYRARAKVKSIKQNSNKKDHKVESLFRLIK